MVPENKVGIERSRKDSRHPVSYESFDVGIRDMIDRVSTTEDAKEVVDKIDRGKKLLESLGIFEENATRFSMLEFEVYLKIAGECLYDDLPVNKKAMAKWCSRLSNDEIDDMRREVMGGCRIVTMYGRHRRKMSAEKKKADIEIRAGLLIEKLDKDGHVEVPVGVGKAESEVYEMVKNYARRRGVTETSVGVFKTHVSDEDVDSFMNTFLFSDHVKDASHVDYMAYRLLYAVKFGNQRVMSRAKKAISAIYESGYLEYDAHVAHLKYVERHLNAIRDSSEKSLNYWSEYE